MRIVGIVLLGLLLFTTGCEPNKSEGFSVIDHDVEFDQLVEAANKIGINMLENIERDERDNVFISPTSLYMALSMVYNGSDSETKEEIAEVLQVHGLDMMEFNRANASLLSNLYNHTDLIDLQIGNSLWLNDRYHFQTNFTKNMENYFNGEMNEIDVLDTKSPEMINKWVDEATHGKIEEIIDGPLDRDLLALLINALYFKGDWVYAFNEKETSKSLFHLNDGSSKEINLMSLEEKLPYFETDDFQAIKLPYGDGEMSMNVFLPKEQSNVTEFIDELTHENWEKWDSKFQEKTGTIRLPKFKLDYETTLNDALIDLGMGHAFDQTKADFSNMIKEDEQIAISKVKQKTFIDVNEKGTEAAAATSVEMKLTSAPIDGPFYMEVNRPFFLTITDEETGANLFLGTIYHPEE